MRTFDENLATYHRQNKIGDFMLRVTSQRLHEAQTIKEMDEIVNEFTQAQQERAKVYKELGKEMAKILSKHWWEFWK